AATADNHRYGTAHSLGKIGGTAHVCRGPPADYSSYCTRRIADMDALVSVKAAHTLPVRTTDHIRRLIKAGRSGVAAQYARPEEMPPMFDDLDPLGEESRFSPTKGLVHKYDSRVLWKVSYRCAAHCQFCTRHRQIGTRDGDLTSSDIA